MRRADRAGESERLTRSRPGRVSGMLDLDFVRARFPALDTPWALLDNAGAARHPGTPGS